MPKAQRNTAALRKIRRTALARDRLTPEIAASLDKAIIEMIAAAAAFRSARQAIAAAELVLAAVTPAELAAARAWSKQFRRDRRKAVPAPAPIVDDLAAQNLAWARREDLRLRDARASGDAGLRGGFSW
jgi:hypothetical protein